MDQPGVPTKVQQIALYAVIAIFAAAAVATCVTILGAQPWGVDFLPMWAGARIAQTDVGKLYDFAVVTAVQFPNVTGHDLIRPYIYPPSALLLFTPFSWLDKTVALVAWTALSLSVFAWAIWTRTPKDRFATAALLLGVLAPPAAITVLAGQISFVIAALTLMGVALLGARPWAAGALFAIAALLKPNLLVFVPVALIAVGAWRALASALIVGVIGFLTSVALWGLDPWFAWLSALPRFTALILNEITLLEDVITPNGQLALLGVAAPIRTGITAALFAAGALLVIWVFRKTEDTPARLAALAACALLASPYAMAYEATLLIPAGVLMMTDVRTPGRWLYGFVALGILGLSLSASLAPAVLLGILVLATLQVTGEKARSSPSS